MGTRDENEAKIGRRMVAGAGTGQRQGWDEDGVEMEEDGNRDRNGMGNEWDKKADRDRTKTGKSRTGTGMR